jgi:hypothetical protein
MLHLQVLQNMHTSQHGEFTGKPDFNYEETLENARRTKNGESSHLSS